MRDFRSAGSDLPNNVDAEQQLLGALLLDGTRVAELSGDAADLFFDQAHAALAREIARRQAAGDLVSPVTLRNFAADHEGLAELGGAAYLVKLAGASVATGFFRDYAQILADLRDRRAIIEAAYGLAEGAADDSQRLYTAMMDFGARVESAEIGGPAPLDTWTAASLAGQPVPPREWLVESLVPSRTVTMLGGDGGTGKSLLALQLAAATAAGADWIGRPVERPGPAMFVSAEDDKEELHRRLAAVVAAEGLDMETLTELHANSLAGQDATLALPDRRTGALTPTERFTALDTTIARLQPALVILDTLSDLFGGEENARPQARAFIGMLRGLAIRHDCAVILLAHPSLSGLSSGAGTSGSTAWNNSVRSRLYFERLTDGGYEPDTDARRLTTKKANYGPAGEEIMLRFEAGRFVVEGGAAGSGLDRMAAGAKAERVFLDLLRLFAEQGRRVNSKGGESYAPRAFEGHPQAGGMTRSAFRAAMERLLNRGAIRISEQGPPSRRSSFLEVVE